jgi:hypothetical protein
MSMPQPTEQYPHVVETHRSDARCAETKPATGSTV